MLSGFLLASTARVINPTSGNEIAMTIGQGAAWADAEIRTSRHHWTWVLVGAGLELAFATFFFVTPAAFSPFSWYAWFWLAMSGLSAAEALWLRTLGVDLTRESAIVRGVRRRTVPWQEVQGVVRQRRLGTWVVQLIPESGRPVTLRAPTTFWGLGVAEYERDYHRIGQWWLAHCGPSWLPATPRPPVQE